MSEAQRAERRPAAATVVAVLCLVVGSLALVGTFFRATAVVLLRLARVFLEAMPDRADSPIELLVLALDATASLSVLLTLLRTAVAGLGLAAGVGLLTRRRWSPSLATWYGGASLAVGLIHYLFVVERIRQLAFSFVGVVDGAAAGLAAGVVALLGAIGFLLGSLFPIAAIVLVNQLRVRGFYRDESPP